MLAGDGRADLVAVRAGQVAVEHEHVVGGRARAGRSASSPSSAMSAAIASRRRPVCSASARKRSSSAISTRIPRTLGAAMLRKRVRNRADAGATAAALGWPAWSPCARARRLIAAHRRPARLAAARSDGAIARIGRCRRSTRTWRSRGSTALRSAVTRRPRRALRRHHLRITSGWRSPRLPAAAARRGDRDLRQRARRAPATSTRRSPRRT